MKKLFYGFIIFALPSIIIGIPHGLRNFGSTCYINSVLQAFDALDPATAYLITLNNPYKQVVGTRPPEAGLAHYYLEFEKKLILLPHTPPSVAHAANTLDYTDFVNIFKRDVLRSSKNEGYITINRSSFPFTKQDKDYITKLNNFYNTTLAELLYRIVYRTPDPLPEKSDLIKLLDSCPQEDVPDFIERLINALIEQDKHYIFATTSAALITHPLGKLFRIEVTKTKECPGYTGTTTEQESRLNLQTTYDEGKKTFTTLQACIDNLLSADTVKYKPFGFEAEQLCVQQPYLTHISDIVILALNRFGWKGKEGIKYKHTIEIPFIYDFARHLPQNYPDQTQYELVAAIEHLGNFGSGHYIAYIKQKDQWYICNDEHVFAVQKSGIGDYSDKWGAGSKERRGINYAYVYFYQKMAGPRLQQVAKEPYDEKQLLTSLQTLIRQLTILELSLKT